MVTLPLYILEPFNLRREYNFSIKDKTHGPNVSIIQRFHSNILVVKDTS